MLSVLGIATANVVCEDDPRVPMLSQFFHALAIALRPRFEFLQDTMTLADGRARILLRAEGIGILFGGDFTAFVNGSYVASLLIPTGKQVRFVFLTALGPFVKRVAVPAMLHVASEPVSTGRSGAHWVDPHSRTRVQWAAASALHARLRVRADARAPSEPPRVEPPRIDRGRLLTGLPGSRHC
jgi:hypothetical protein